MKACCQTSVGVLITDPHGRDLLIQRARPPVGIAPVAGHALDEHPSFLAAAVTEVAEEVGLTVAEHGLTKVDERWLPNRCRRRLYPRPYITRPGHHWRVYQARHWDGRLAPSAQETAGTVWSTPTQLQELAGRTIAYAREEITTAEFAAAPGLEPVWVVLLTHLHRITVGVGDLRRVLTLAETPPAPSTAPGVVA